MLAAALATFWNMIQASNDTWRPGTVTMDM